MPNLSASRQEPEQNITATSSRTQFVHVKNRTLAYRDIGNGDPLILCQRFRGNLDDWDPKFLDALAANYRVITFNYSGMASSTGEPGTNMLMFAADVLDLVDALGIEKFILGGWSFGGWVAQIVTVEYPHRVKQTILIGTKPPGKVDYQMEEVFLKTAYIPDYTLEHEEILFFEPISEKSRLAAKESHERINARSIDRDIKVKPELWEYYGKGNEDFTADPYGARKKMMNTDIPVLVISGDHEVCFPPQNWFNLNRELPTTSLIVLPRAGHGPQHQYPKMVSEFIHSFILDQS